MTPQQRRPRWFGFLQQLTVAVALAATGLGIALTPPMDAARAEAPDPLARQFGGPFTLTSHDGRKIADTDFRGRFMLIYFGYTTCPDICPVDLAQQATALDILGGDADKIQPLFVSVDPKRDTPERLSEFVAAFHPRLIGLTGTEPEIAAIARAYKIHRRKLLQRADAHQDHAAHKGHAGHKGHHGHDGHGAHHGPQHDAAGQENSDDYLVDHGSLTFLMGPDGAFRALLPRTFSPERMAEIMAKYVSAD